MRERDLIEERVDRLLAEQIRRSEVNGGYFSEQWQLGLHCFIKSLYFERKQRLRKSECILKEYYLLSERLISLHDILTYFKVIFSFDITPFQQEIHAQLGKALYNPR